MRVRSRWALWLMLAVIALAVSLVSVVSLAGAQPPGVVLNSNGLSYISWMFDIPQNQGDWVNTCSAGCGGHLRDDYYADDWALPAAGGLTGEQRTSGRTVYAGISGVAIVMPNHGDYGNDVVIYDADSKFALRNAHLSEIIVTNGQQVIAGTPIGKVGKSGKVTGSHLHIVLYKGVTDTTTRPVTFTTLQGGPGPTQYAAPFLYVARAAVPTVTASLIITPSSPYLVGQTLTARFTIQNKGTAPITFKELVAGGRLNDVHDCSNYSGCPDFTKVFNLTLEPGASYAYQGTFTPAKPGSYEFQVFYMLPDGTWHWSLPTGPGVVNLVRITVATPPVTVTKPTPLSPGEPLGSAHTAISPTAITFSWTKNNTGATYALYVSDITNLDDNVSADPSRLVINGLNVDDASSYVWTGAAAGKKYRWQVQAVKSGATALSDRLVFTTQAAVVGSRLPGIDVSHHQGDIKWTEVKAAGKQFVFVKATQRTDFVDSKFTLNMPGAKAAGILAGAYHFACPERNDALFCPQANSATAEAQHFVNTARNYLQSGYLRPALDLEVGAGLGKVALSAWVREWMMTVTNLTGLKPILYVNSHYASNYLEPSIAQDYDLWIAHWTNDANLHPNIGVWQTWAFWQYSSQGAVSGISGFVDLNVFAGGLSQLQAYVITASPPPATKLAFLMQPSNTAVAATISPPVQVAVQDAAGTTVTAATNPITIAIGTNPGGGTLSGTLTVNAVNGVASFSNLSINQAGNGYTLVATASRLTGATSAAFNIMTTVGTAPGIITTVAGTGTSGFSGDGGHATSANLYYPHGVAVDAAGNLFIADAFNHRVRKVAASTGVITVVAGTGTAGFSGDGGPATSATLNMPLAVAADRRGDLFIADGDRIRRVHATTGIITTVTLLSGRPSGVTVDGAGNLFFTHGDRVSRVDAATGIITTVAGGGASSLGDGGPATNASLVSPDELAVDGAGNLFVAEFHNHRIRKVAAATGIISTVAGNGIAGFSGDGGPATSASLASPSGVTVDTGGNLFIADGANYRVRKVAARTGVITTVAGIGGHAFSGDGGLATNASLTFPHGVAVDAAGNLFIADTNNHRIRKVTGVAALGPLVAGIGPGVLQLTVRSDNFDDNSLDRTLWSPSEVLAPGSGSVTETNKRLEITVGPGAGGAGVSSVGSLSGDFDLQVDFNIMTWPANNPLGIRLAALDLGRSPIGLVGMHRTGGGTGAYSMGLPDRSLNYPANDSSGKLRLVRVGSMVTGCYYSEATWIGLTSGSVPTDATRIALDLSGSDANAPGGVSVAFDNFQVNPPPRLRANTTTTLVSSPNPSVFGQPVTITVTVTPADLGGGMPTGTVVLSADGTRFSKVRLEGGVARVTSDRVPAATRTITAEYGGDCDRFNPSRGELIQTVGEASTISGTVTLQGRTATFPTGVGHGIARVTLNPGGVTVTANADGSFQITNVAAGTYTLTASAPGYVSRQRTNVVVGSSTVTLPSTQLRCGLVNNDNFVNINDITATVASFGKTVADRVDAQGRFVDQNGDGFVNINDITCVVSGFGKTSPEPWE